MAAQDADPTQHLSSSPPATSPNAKTLTPITIPGKERKARFAEATTFASPIEAPPARRAFAAMPSTEHLFPEPQVSDVGFGYISDNRVKHTSIEVPIEPSSPLRSALKVPNTPGRFLNPLSPTFREELKLEEEEALTEKDNARDVNVKKRIRVAKFFLRGVNFSCALVIISMLSVTFFIFNTTKTLPPRNNSPPWAVGQQIWPQITLLTIASISLLFTIFIMYMYWKGGHRRVRKTVVWHTLFALAFFAFSTVMWIFSAAMLHASKANGGGQDLWGWACNDNKRATLFQDEIQYTIVCRLQNWSLICSFIEIVVEVISIIIYSVVLYRLWSKRKLMLRMEQRDKARQDLYQAQLRIASQPNTPAPNAFFNGAPTPRNKEFFDSKRPIVKETPRDDSDSEDSVDEAKRAAYAEDSDEQDYAARHAQFMQQSAEQQAQVARNRLSGVGLSLPGPPPGGPYAFQGHVTSPTHVQTNTGMNIPTLTFHGATPVIEQGGFQENYGGNVVSADEVDGEVKYESVAIPSSYH